MFPSLGLSREAFLTAAEFGTQELRRPAQLRLQVFRPVGEAGGTLSGGGEVSVLSRALVPWLLDWPPAIHRETHSALGSPGLRVSPDPVSGGGEA